MAEEFESRTEAATPRRREEAREQGQVAFSAELVTGVFLLAGIAALSLGASRLGGGLLTEARLGLAGARPLEMSVGEAQGLLGHAFSSCLELAAPLFAMLSVGALAACLIQVGFYPNPALLT